VKLAPEVLIELVDIFRRGLAECRDMSETMRELDLEVVDGKIQLSNEYRVKVGRSKQVLND
jgi:hypothetical protein